MANYYKLYIEIQQKVESGGVRHTRHLLILTHLSPVVHVRVLYHINDIKKKWTIDKRTSLRIRPSVKRLLAQMRVLEVFLNQTWARKREHARTDFIAVH